VSPRVALVRLSSLGDVTLASAALDALAGRVEVALATRAAFAPLFDGDTRIARLVPVDPDDLDPARAELAGFEPEWVVDLQGTLRSRQLVAGLPARRLRVRKASLRRRLAVVGWTHGLSGRVYERYLETLEPIVGETPAARPRLVVPERPARLAAERIDTRAVGIVPGAAWANKRWPLDRWIALVRALLLEDRALPVVAFVAPEETEIGDRLDATFAGEPRVRTLRLPVGELPAHLARLHVLVTADSGPLHVAEAVGTPVVALFGPTVRGFGFAPFRRKSRVVERRLMCRPCHVHGGDRCPLAHHRCMRDITVADIIEEVRPLIDAQASASVATPRSIEGG
jgi:heptosyltransferase-2